MTLIVVGSIIILATLAFIFFKKREKKSRMDRKDFFENIDFKKAKIWGDLFENIDFGDVKTEKRLVQQEERTDHDKPCIPQMPPTVLSIPLNGLRPFTPLENQIIYIETYFSENINSYIQDNYIKLQEDFKKKGYTFIYLPIYINELTRTAINSSAQYMYPHINVQNYRSENANAQMIEAAILKWLKRSSIKITSGLLKYENEERNSFKYLPIPERTPEIIWEWDTAFSHARNRRRIHRKEGQREYENAYGHFDNPDLDIPYEAHILVKEIQEKIDNLRKLGIDDLILRSLLSITEPVKLSRLTITKEYKIILPDYNNMEIMLHPLPKALYILYLKHPEGIMFKHLSNYKEELTNIYKEITNREHLWMVQKSIDDMVNPTKNAINEKCSRIKEAFVGSFDDHIASHYYITGHRATRKKITLDRELVFFESD